MEQAVAWRTTTRRAFMFYQKRDYEVATFYRAGNGRCFYLLRLRGSAGF
jgi:hypothetical protein